MQIDQSQTYGKVLRKQKNLRKTDSKAQVMHLQKHQQEYVDYLVSKGMQINKIQLAVFQLRNGLPYPGIICISELMKPTNKFTRTKFW